MSDEFSSFLLGTIPLDVMLAGALYLTVARRPTLEDRRDTLRLTALAALSVAVQCGHFAEEWATDFNVRYPELLGLHPWSVQLWATFNFIWISIWVLSIAGLLIRWRPALFPVWFLAIGCAVNGVAHPLLSIVAAGYFPGLWTSPLAGVAGFVLLSRLVKSTRNDVPIGDTG